MFECKFCGNEYRQSIAQCPTCGGRSFKNNNDLLMTTQWGGVGYWGFGGLMSQPCVVQLSSAQLMYPMSGGSYAIKES